MYAIRTSALLGALCLLTSTNPLAQELVYTLGVEATNNDDFGRAVADAGDLDGDGHSDVIVGAPFDDANGTSSGSVFAYSGRTGELLWTRAGDYPGDLFGWSVDGIGDITGDGKSEVIVGAPLWDNNGAWSSAGGKAYVLSGSGVGTPMTVALNEQGAQLGYEVRGLGDITGDGLGDFAVAIPFRDWNGKTDNGYISFYSGAGTQFLFSRSGDVDGAKFGYSMDVVRATGAQATSRLLVGEPGVDNGGTDRGQARLMDGFGNTMSLFAGSTNNEWTGACVAGLGDVNNDGWEDYAIGAPYADILGVGTDAGRVRVYSGASTSQLYAVNGASASATMGQSISKLGDVNGDGRDDFLVGAPNDDSVASDGGEARVVSGLNGATLASFSGGTNDHVGREVSSAGDLNNDGLADFIIGANDAPFGAGEAYVYLSGLDAPTVYCAAKVNSQGCTPSISTEGVASLSIAESFHLRAADVINQKFGLMFWGTASLNQPFMGGSLCVQAPLTRSDVQSSGGSAAGTDCTGSFDFHFSHAYMAAESVAPGTRVHAQYWYRDPASSFQVGLTDAVAFDVVP